MYTREQFETIRRDSAREMARDQALKKQAYDIILKADKYNWIHQSNWFGEPYLQLAQDIIALQEIIFRTRPKYIVDIGTAWGGGLLFYATLFEVLGGEKVIGVDIYIPDDLKERINSHPKIANKIHWINRSSTESEALDEVKSMVGESKEVLVLLDSFHTHDHVLKELKMYSQLVGQGHYLVCFDTYVDIIPEIVSNRPRPWGAGNNPMTAVQAFLKEDSSFEVDTEMESKLLLTLAPGGYLKKKVA